MAPPKLLLLLPEKVESVTVSVPLLLFKMAPPLLALLPEKVLLVTVAAPTMLKMAPPMLTPGGVLPEKVLLVTVSVPALAMAPPLAKAPGLLPEKVLLVTLSVPRLSMAPPLPVECPLAMVRFSTVNVTPEFTENTPTALPPLMVITLPPSMVVAALMVFVLVTVIVAAAPTQAKVTVPLKLLPPGRQACNAASVQLALVPVPTTHAKAGDVVEVVDEVLVDVLVVVEVEDD